MPKLRLVTFNVVDTLVKYASPVGEVYASIGSKHGIQADPGDLEKSFCKNFKIMSIEKPNFGRAHFGWQAWWRELVKRTFSEVAEDVPEKHMIKLSQDLIEVYTQASCMRPVDGVEDLLHYLKSCGVCMGVISNNDPRILIILRKLGLAQFFSISVVSYRAGAMKPSKGIFEAAEAEYLKSQRKNLVNSVIMHLGNSPSNDYFGAKNAGWLAGLLEPKPEITLSKYPAIKRHFVFTSIPRFKHFVGDFQSW